jgi:hypothetical protein
MIISAPRRSAVTPNELAGIIENRETPAGEYAGAVIEDSFNQSIPGTVLRDIRVPDDDRMVDPKQGIGRAPPKMVRTDEPLMSEEAWKSSEFYRESIPFDNRMTEARAKAKAEIHDEDRFLSWQRQNRPWSAGQVATAVIGSLIGSAPDPTNYIPVLGPAFKAATAGRIANILRRSAIQGLDAAIVTGAVQPIISQSRRSFGDDVSFADQLTDVAVSAVLGATMGGVVGWREKLPSYRPETVRSAVDTLHQAANDVAMERPISMPPINARQFTDMVRLAGDDTMARASDDLVGLLNPRADGPAFDVGKIDAATAENIPAYVRDIVKPQQGAQSATRFTFDLGSLPEPLANLAGKLNEGMGATKNNVRLSNQVIEKLYRQNPTIADELLARLPDLMARPSEMLPDHQNANRILLTKPFRTGRQETRNQVAVMELARKADGYEVVSIHSSPDRTLSKAREALGERLSAGGEATVLSYGGASRTPPAAADFPTVTSDRTNNVGAVDSAVKAAEQRIGKPLNDTRKLAEEQEINIDSGEFPEAADLQKLIDNEQLNESEIEALREIDRVAKQADGYAKAYEAAAFCLGRKG